MKLSITSKLFARSKEKIHCFVIMFFYLTLNWRFFILRNKLQINDRIRFFLVN